MREPFKIASVIVGLLFLMGLIGSAFASDDEPAAAPATAVAAKPAAKASNRKAAKVAAIGREVERLTKHGQRLAVRYQGNGCAAIPKFSAIVDRVDDLVYKLQDLGYPNPALEKANDNTRMRLADLIGTCLR